MSTWYLSENGTISGPFSLEKAKKKATQNPKLFGWAPKFSQWQPVAAISEFDLLIDSDAQQDNIVTEIRQKFAIRKQRLDKKSSVIEQHVEANNALLKQLNEEINTYHQLTANLSDSVKTAITPLEKAYKNLNEKQAMLADAAAIAAEEVDQIVARFEAKTAGKSSAPSAAINEDVEDEDIEVIDINESELIDIEDQQLEVQASANIKEINEVVEEPQVQQPTPQPKAEQPAQQAKQAEVVTESAQRKQNKAVDEIDNATSAVKGLFKSVFKAETAPAPQTKSLSELLAEQEKEESSDAGDDDSAKRTRRRRRRR